MELSSNVSDSDSWQCWWLHNGDCRFVLIRQDTAYPEHVGEDEQGESFRHRNRVHQAVVGIAGVVGVIAGGAVAWWGYTHGEPFLGIMFAMLAASCFQGLSAGTPWQRWN